MKKYLLIIVCMAHGYLCLAESFTTELWFEDKDGNKDTLVVGYSDNSSECELQTDSWSEDDALQSLKSGEHWAWFGRSGSGYPCNPHRIHINPPTQGDIEYYKIRIWYPQDRLPVTVSWNPDDFSDPSRDRSLFSELSSWFDAADIGEELERAFANEVSSVTLSVNQWKQVKLQEELIYVNALGFAFCSRAVWEEEQANQNEWWKHIDDAIEDVVSLPNASKTLHNGQLLIRHGEKTYDAQGREVR